MCQFHSNLLIDLFVLTLLVPACQQLATNENTQALKEVTPISQEVAGLPILTPTLTNFPSPLPTSTSLPVATPTPRSASQGDQLPTRTPTPPPMPTAIPANVPPIPTLASTLIPLLTGAPSLNQVDLSTLSESLVLLDRLERRKVEPTSTPVGPIIYKGVSTYPIEKSGCSSNCEELGYCEGIPLTAEVFIDGNGNVSGVFQPPKGISFSGTRAFMSGIVEFTAYDLSYNCEATCIAKLQAKLTENDQKFEGTVEDTCVPCGKDVCEFIRPLSLDRK